MQHPVCAAPKAGAQHTVAPPPGWGVSDERYQKGLTQLAARPAPTAACTPMSDEQDRGRDAQQPRWLEVMASRNVCPETVAGRVYYCDEHDTHGNADSQDEARYMAAAHTDFFIQLGEEGDDPCDVFVFARGDGGNQTS